MDGYKHFEHGFAPVFDSRSKVLVLGSFPSIQSRENEFFYGNPHNRFWKVIATLFDKEVPPNTPVAQSIKTKKQLLADCRVALWDVIASCDIRGSSDSSIRNVVPNDLYSILKTSNITGVFGNGATATKLYRQHLQEQTGLEIVRLPTTSPANAAYSLERLLAYWKVLRCD